MGLIKDMPFADYLAVDALSSTGLKQLARSAWHYKNRVDIVPTRPMLQGTLAHCAVLEPDAMASRYAVVPSDAPRRPSKSQWHAKKPSPESIDAMSWWTGFQERCAGLEIVSAEDYEVTEMQLAALAAEPTISELLSVGYGECSVFWVDKETGVYCKARPDWVRPLGVRKTTKVKLLDLKSTADESPSGFGRTSARLRYDLQMAHYVDGFEAATGIEVECFIFAAVTSVPPVLAVPYILIEEIEAQGYDERRELIQLYARCQQSGHWPAYGSGLQLLDFPAYAKRSQELEVSYVN